MAQLYRLADLIAIRARSTAAATQPAPRNSSLTEEPRGLKTLRY